MPVDLMTGLLAFGLAVVGSILLRFLIAYANARDRRRNDALRQAITRTGQWTLGIAVGFGTAVSMGLIQFGDIIGTVFGFVGGHPFFASNVGIIGLAVGVFEGLVSLSTQQFVGIAMMIVGAIFLATEVDDVLG